MPRLVCRDKIGVIAKGTVTQPGRATAPATAAPQNTPTVAVSYRGPSLRARLACLVALIVAAVVGSGSYLLMRVFETRVDREIRQSVLLAARGVADALEVEDAEPVPAALAPQLAASVERPPARTMTVVRFGPSGARLWAASSASATRAEDEALAERAYSARSEVWGRQAGALCMVAVPFVRGGVVAGSVVATGSLQAVREVRETGGRAVFWFAAAAVIILTILVDLFARPLMYRPLAEMLDTIRRAGAGATGARAVVHRDDEIGAVAAGLNDLLTRTEELHASLQERVDEATGELRKRNDELVASYQRMFGMREALARAQQTAAAGQTAANLAHQIGTPLNLISGYVQMMLEGEEARTSGGAGAKDHPATRIERLRAVQEQIRKVSDVVRTTLAAVRQGPMTKDPVFPAAILRRMVEVARPRLTAAGIDLELRIEDDLPWLIGDAVQLELALLNLVNNSLDAMRAGGHVSIVSARTSAGTRIQVSDNGPGIALDLLPRIFEPWVTTKPAGRGTGLGLSITREVIAAHGGSISVHSEAGRGTTFTIELPGKAGAPAIREA